MKAIASFVARKPYVAATVAGLTLLGVIVYFLASALLTPDMPAASGPSQIKMNNVQVQGQRGTQLGWKFEAQSADTSTDGALTTYHHVNKAVYYLGGKPAYLMSAEEVTLDTRSQNYTGSGSVHVWSVRPRDLSDLRTDTVMWSNPLQSLTCPTQVHVKYKGYEMVTTHLQANLATGASTLGATSINGRSL